MKQSKPSKQKYTVLKDFELAHQPYRKGDTADLFPKQATYLITGGFLAPAKPARTQSSTRKAKE